MWVYKRTGFKSCDNEDSSDAKKPKSMCLKTLDDFDLVESAKEILIKDMKNDTKRETKESSKRYFRLKTLFKLGERCPLNIWP